MRREGFELSVSPPQVLLRQGEQGQRLEPLEELVCEVEEAHSGELIEAVTLRRGELLEMGPAAGAEGRQRLVFEAPARGLIGFRTAFSAVTRGSGLLHRAFSRWGDHRGPLDRVRKGALVAVGGGKATLHALGLLEARGALFVGPGTEVYEGMVVGESSREADLEINPVREKKLTNVRNTGSEERVHLSPPRAMTLEEAIGYVGADELMEVTPGAVRLRKRVLESGARRAGKRKAGG
jgi:GTP-binding protein